MGSHGRTVSRSLLFLEGELIMSCTFDLVNETCPIVPKSDQHIKLGAQADQIQSISDHTRGGKRRLSRSSARHVLS